MPNHEVITVPQAGLAGLKNGKLLAAIRNRFDVFVTIDANLEYQQNLADLEFAVIVIHAQSNRFPDLEPLAEKLRTAVESTPVGNVAHVSQR